MGAAIQAIAEMLKALADWRKAKKAKRQKKKQKAAEKQRLKSKWSAWREERRRIGDENKARNAERIAAMRVDVDDDPYGEGE